MTATIPPAPPHAAHAPSYPPPSLPQAEPPPDMAKLKQWLKDTFTSFNAAVERIYNSQCAWVIPEPGLRAAVRRVVKADCVPPYQEFLRRWGEWWRACCTQQVCLGACRVSLGVWGVVRSHVVPPGLVPPRGRGMTGEGSHRRAAPRSLRGASPSGRSGLKRLPSEPS